MVERLENLHTWQRYAKRTVHNNRVLVVPVVALAHPHGRGPTWGAPYAWTYTRSRVDCHSRFVDPLLSSFLPTFLPSYLATSLPCRPVLTWILLTTILVAGLGSWLVGFCKIALVGIWARALLKGREVYVATLHAAVAEPC